MSERDLILRTLQEAAFLAEERAAGYGGMMRAACEAVARDIRRRMAEVAAEKELVTR